MSNNRCLKYNKIQSYIKHIVWKISSLSLKVEIKQKSAWETENKTNLYHLYVSESVLYNQSSSIW